ncbi:MAG: hypothetical protein NC923_01965 [Candidatus Omnitrophica bacterium]|nr:hypothetical protein [Candidatus Omnitrophota bacterium]
MTHTLIPPGRKTYNSDVETFHKLIEDEFYRIEAPTSLDDFLAKAYAYTFNLISKERIPTKASFALSKLKTRGAADKPSSTDVSPCYP